MLFPPLLPEHKGSPSAQPLPAPGLQRLLEAQSLSGASGKEAEPTGRSWTACREKLSPPQSDTDVPNGETAPLTGPQSQCDGTRQGLSKQHATGPCSMGLGGLVHAVLLICLAFCECLPITSETSQGHVLCQPLDQNGRGTHLCLFSLYVLVITLGTWWACLQGTREIPRWSS